MGYFKRKLDRHRARHLVREFNDADVEGKAWEKLPGRPPRRTGFVRFSARDRLQSSGRRRGIFSAAYSVIEEDATDPVHREALRDALEWFERELPVPRISKPRAVFFFRTEAHECMKHIWSLVHALRDMDVWVEMQTFKHPGRIVYEDEHQVAVLPAADVESI
jgi:hypothetical protein